MKTKIISLGLILGLVAFSSQGEEEKGPKILLENPQAIFYYEGGKKVVRLYAEDDCQIFFLNIKFRNETKIRRKRL